MNKQIVDSPPYSTEDIQNILTKSSTDLENAVLHIDAIQELNYDLEKIFGNRSSIIFFIPNINNADDVGHFVLLTHVSNDNIEYFDSFGNLPHAFVMEIVRRNKGMTITYSKRKLQNKNSYICGKYCLLRMQSQPSHLDDFIDILLSNKRLSPDKVVDTLIKTKYER